MADPDYTCSPPAIEKNLTSQKSTENAVSDDVSGHSGEKNQEVLPETVSNSLVNDLDPVEKVDGEDSRVFPTKALANTVMTKLLTTRYDDHNSIRDHIILNEIQIICVQKEEKLNQNKLEISHLAETNSDRKRTFRASENKGYVTHANYQLKGTTQIRKQNNRKERKCFFCRKKGHLKRACLKYKNLDLSKHIKIKYLVVREKVRVLVVSIEHISRKLMVVVTLTKGLSLKWFVEHVAHMNLTNL
ncbi:hypothetical protein AMTRI_Chr09g40030 [Amborella trichopoda]